MVQFRDDTFVIDRCRRSGETLHPLEFKVYKNDDVTGHTRVYTNQNRRLFQFVLPSGAVVGVRVARYLLDVWIVPSAMDRSLTTGLCGTYDGDNENDLTLSNKDILKVADVFAWRGRPLPTDFVNSWRPQTTLFFGVPAEDFTSTIDLSPKCHCMNDTCSPANIIETCDVVFSELEIMESLDIFVQMQGRSGRQKRQAEGPWAAIDYDPNNPSVQFPTWPTASGVTEAQATQSCESALQSHPSWSICSTVLDTTALLSSCVIDVLLADTEELIIDSVESMKIQCKLAVMTDPSVAARLNVTQEQLMATLLNLTCEYDCSRNGICINDVCQCDPGFQGDDCSVTMDTAPTITSLSENLYTSTGETTVTTTVTVFGEGFVNSDLLTCHLQQVEITSSGYNITSVTSVSNATFLTTGSLLCDLTGSLPLTGYWLSMSNNGVNQSNKTMFIFQDSVCYDCDPAQFVCNYKPTSCVIDGQCYAAGAYSPTDQCLLCDPISNTWKYKPSASCTTTSSSTYTTTTSSTASSTSSTYSSTSSTSSSTSSTTSSTSSTTSSTSSTSVSTKISSSTSTTPTTQPDKKGDTDGQNAEKDSDSEQQTLTIVIIVGVCVAVLIIIATVCFAVRLKRKDDRASETSSNDSSSTDIKHRGRANPSFRFVEESRPIGSDPVIQPMRITQQYSASFNVEGLEGPAGSPEMYEDDPDLQAVQVALFEDPHVKVSSTDGLGRSSPLRSPKRSPKRSRREYDNVEEVPVLAIPRPELVSPIVIYPELKGSGGISQQYVATRTEAQDPPMPDYYEADDYGGMTKL